VAVHLITGAVTAVQNVVRSVNRAGLTVQDVVLQPLASGESVLTPDERDLGVILIDIGGGTTDVALFREGAVWHTAVIPLGGDHISNDIAVGLRTPPPDAEELKKIFGCAQATLVLEDETVEVPSIGGRKPGPVAADARGSSRPAWRRSDAGGPGIGRPAWRTRRRRAWW
jgi:cell division protein FtsA